MHHCLQELGYFVFNNKESENGKTVPRYDKRGSKKSGDTTALQHVSSPLNRVASLVAKMLKEWKGDTMMQVFQVTDSIYKHPPAQSNKRKFSQLEWDSDKNSSNDEEEEDETPSTAKKNQRSKKQIKLSNNKHLLPLMEEMRQHLHLPEVKTHQRRTK